MITAAVNRGSVSYNGTLEIEIGGTLPGSGFDQVNHILGAGIANLASTLDVSLLGDFTPAAGDLFEIITAVSVVDTFAVETLPALVGGLEWFVKYSGTSVELISTFAGDFDFDGDVDDNDFPAWQRGDSPVPLSQSDLDDWQANFGNPSLAVTASIPEPSTLVIGAMAAVELLVRRSVMGCVETDK